MPEGDTVWRTAHRLDTALRGGELTRSDLRWPSVAELDLRGASTVGVVPRGKHLLHRLDTGLTIHSHLRMEGQWRVVATPELTPGALANSTLRAALGTTAWTALGLRLGMLDVVPTAAEHTLVGHLGPDVLDPPRPGSIARRWAGSSSGPGRSCGPTCPMPSRAPPGSGRPASAAMSMAGWRSRAAGAASRCGSVDRAGADRRARRSGRSSTVRPARADSRPPTGESHNVRWGRVLDAVSGSPDVPLTGRPSKATATASTSAARRETSLSTADSGTSRASQIAASSSEDASFSPRSTSLR